MAKVLILCVCFLLINVIVAEELNKYSPRYHLAPETGSLSAPSAFCQYHGDFHIFYQFSPTTTKLNEGIANWGHAKSSNLFDWENLPIIIQPDTKYDSDGVLAGSAIVEDDKLYLFYTGNRVTPGNLTKLQLPSTNQRQALAISSDGINATKFKNNPIIKGNGFQPDFRNPFVWKNGDTYYMIVGNSKNLRGRVLLYTSKTKTEWKYESVLYESDGTLGYMWENPSIFELNNKFVFIFTPRGIPPRGDKFKNSCITGYIVGNLDYEKKKFEPLNKFAVIDHGHDFCYVKTMKTTSLFSRRLIVAWLGSPGEIYPDRLGESAGVLSVVRELTLNNDNVLLQSPANEADRLSTTSVYYGTNADGKFIKIPNRAAEVYITADNHKTLFVSIGSENVLSNVTIVYEHIYGTVTLSRGLLDGARKTFWRPSGLTLNWRIFIDASSVELFCGDGELTMSSRFFPEDEIYVTVSPNVNNLNIKAIKPTVPIEEENVTEKKSDTEKE